MILTTLKNIEPIRLLVIDDDKKLCLLIQDYLEPMGYSVQMEHDGISGAERVIAEDFAAVILDVMIPGMDGFETLKRIRAHKSTPVLMLTARGEEADRIVGLELGADDYIPKNFSNRELLARLRAVIRRSNQTNITSAAPDTNQTRLDPELVAGPLRVNPNNRTVFLNDSPISLTPVELDLLISLMKSSGKVRSRDTLLDEARNRDYEVFDRSIDVHISSLRKKLGDDPKRPRFIKTLRTAGYNFDYNS